MQMLHQPESLISSDLFGNGIGMSAFPNWQQYEVLQLLTPPAPRIERIWFWPFIEGLPVISIPDADFWTSNSLLKSTNLAGPWIEISQSGLQFNASGLPPTFSQGFGYVAREEFANTGIHLTDNTEQSFKHGRSFYRFVVKPWTNLVP